MTVNHKDDQVAAAAIHSLEYLIFRGLQPFQVFIKYVLSILILKFVLVVGATGQITLYLSVSLHLYLWRIGKSFTRE